MFSTPQESQQPRHRSRQAIVAAGWIAARCLGGVGGCKDPGFLDPLGDEVLLEPLFAVREARDVVTGAPLPTVRVGAFVWHGVPVAAREQLWASPEYHARLEGDDLVCTVPGAFGFAEGRWQMVISRAGYRDTTAVLDARYARRAMDGGTWRHSGPVLLRLMLAPQ